MIQIMLFAYYILNNASYNSLNSTSGLLQAVNNGLAASANASGIPLPNPLGIGILFIIFIVITAVSSFKTEISLAAAFGALVSTAVALLLATPSLALVGGNIIYLFGGLTILFMALALLRNVGKPYR